MRLQIKNQKVINEIYLKLYQIEAQTDDNNRTGRLVKKRGKLFDSIFHDRLM